MDTIFRRNLMYTVNYYYQLTKTVVHLSFHMYKKLQLNVLRIVDIFQY